MEKEIIVALIITVPSIITAVLALLTLNQTKVIHVAMNSRMTELLEINKKASKAEGKIEERAEEKERNDNVR